MGNYRNFKLVVYFVAGGVKNTTQPHRENGSRVDDPCGVKGQRPAGVEGRSSSPCNFRRNMVRW